MAIWRERVSVRRIPSGVFDGMAMRGDEDKGCRIGLHEQKVEPAEREGRDLGDDRADRHGTT